MSGANTTSRRAVEQIDTTNPFQKMRIDDEGYFIVTCDCGNELKIGDPGPDQQNTVRCACLRLVSVIT